MKQVTVLKLGGSVITFKEKFFTPNESAITRLADEIKRAHVESIVVVHGGGSFGHPLAEEYEVAGGYKQSGQLMGFSKTHQAMTSLNGLVIDALVRKDIPAFALQPSAFLVTRRGRVSEFDRTIINSMLEMHLVPVLYGDAVLDGEQGFAILSGDQLVAVLAAHFTSVRVIICVDVDGLYTDDPKLCSDARLIGKVSYGKLKALLDQIGKSVTVDVTGGMYGKIAELMPAVEKGVEITIINGSKSNRLYRTLIDQDIVGTKIGS